MLMRICLAHDEEMIDLTDEIPRRSVDGLSEIQDGQQTPISIRRRLHT